jgi:hypothetical protein
MSKEMRKQIERVKNWKQFLNEDKKEYPYEDKNILVLSVKYSKGGVEQQADIQFNSGELFTDEINVNYVGVINLPNNIKTMEDVVDFIFDYSYAPKSFVKILSVKYPKYISSHTTHLIIDNEKTEEMIEYLNKKKSG